MTITAPIGPMCHIHRKNGDGDYIVEVLVPVQGERISERFEQVIFYPELPRSSPSRTSGYVEVVTFNCHYASIRVIAELSKLLAESSYSELEKRCDTWDTEHPVQLTKRFSQVYGSKPHFECVQILYKSLECELQKLPETVRTAREWEDWGVSIDVYSLVTNTSWKHVLFKDKEPKDPIDCFKKALELDPKSPQHWHVLGCYLQPIELRFQQLKMLRLECVNQEEVNAERCYLKAVTCDPHYARSWFQLARLLCEKPQSTTETLSWKECCAKAIQERPQKGRYWLLLIDHLKYNEVVTIGGIQKTYIECCIEAVQLMPKGSALWVKLATALRTDLTNKERTEKVIARITNGGRTEEVTASDCLCRALKYDPSNHQLWFWLYEWNHLDCEITLKTAVGARKEVQDFELESIPSGDDIHQMVKAPPDGTDSGSKGCASLPHPTAVFRITVGGTKTTGVGCLIKAIELAPNEALYWSEISEYLQVGSVTSISLKIDGAQRQITLIDSCIKLFELTEDMLAPQGIADFWRGMAQRLQAHTGGAVYLRKNKLSPEFCYCKAIEYAPSDNWYDLGVLLQNAGIPNKRVQISGHEKDTGAQECFIEDLAVNSTHADAWLRLSRTLSKNQTVSISSVSSPLNAQECLLQGLSHADEDKEVKASILYELGCLMLPFDPPIAGANGKIWSQLDCAMQAVENNPKMERGWNLLGAILRDQNQSITVKGGIYTAKTCFDRALTINPNNVETLLALARLHQNNNIAEAKRCYIKAAKLPHATSEVFIHLGQILSDSESITLEKMQLNRQRCYVHAAEKYGNIESWYALGCYLINRKSVNVNNKPVLAQDCFLKVLAQDGKHKDAWVRIVDTMKKGQTITVGNANPRDAKACCQRALYLDPSCARSWCQLGFLLGSEESVTIGNKPYLRRDCFLNALKNDSQLASAWDGLGSVLKKEETIILEGQPSPKTARDCYLHALQINPQLASSWEHLYTTFSSITDSTLSLTGDLITAEACCIKAVELNPQSAHWGALGHLLIKNPNKKIVIEDMNLTAKECFVKAVNLDVNNVYGWKCLGYALDTSREEALVNKKKMTAKDCWLEALRLDKGCGQTWFYLGWSMLHPNNGQLIDMAEKITARKPTVTVPGKGSYTARECFIKGFELDPTFQNVDAYVDILKRGLLPGQSITVAGKVITG